MSLSCSVPSVPMAVMRDRIGSRAASERIPLWAYVEIIATCNFSCKHCYIAPCAVREDVMSLAECETLFDKLAAAGTLSLLLTGGEVFTHKQFKDIYLAAKQRGMMVYVNTNAYLIGERWADFLAEWPPQNISISLYGLSDERYEAVTGIPNAFNRVVKAIDLLVARGLNVELKCPAMALTVDEIPAMKQFAAERGLSFRYDSIMTPEEKGTSTMPLQLQLAPKRVVALDNVMDPGFANLKEYADRAINQVKPDGSVYKCGAGRIALAINVKGGASTCLSSRQTVGNLLQQPFDEVWAALGGKVAKKFPDGHPCATCKFRSVCAGCPATVESVTGLPEGYVQSYCRITHLRAYQMGHHATGIPRTVSEGIPEHVVIAPGENRRSLPVLA